MCFCHSKLIKSTQIWTKPSNIRLIFVQSPFHSCKTDSHNTFYITFFKAVISVTYFCVTTFLLRCFANPLSSMIHRWNTSYFNKIWLAINLVWWRNYSPLFTFHHKPVAWYKLMQTKCKTKKYQNIYPWHYYISLHHNKQLSTQKYGITTGTLSKPLDLLDIIFLCVCSWIRSV